MADSVKENSYPTTTTTRKDTGSVVGDKGSPQPEVTTAATISTQTDPVRIVYPGDPLYDLVPDIPVQLVSPVDSKPVPPSSATPTLPSPSTELPSNKQAKGESMTATASSDNDFATPVATPISKVQAMTGQLTKKRKASESLDTEDDDVRIDIVSDDEETGSDYAPAATKGKSKGKAAPAKGKTTKTKAATKKAVKGREASSSPMPKKEKAKPKKKESETSSSSPTKKTKATSQTKKPIKAAGFDPNAVAALAEEYPDFYWQAFANDDENEQTMIGSINEEHPLELIPGANIRDHGHITGMVLSPDGSMLATFCNLGLAKIWNLDTFEVIQNLKDDKEENIDEFYVGRFTPDMLHLVVGGKLKDRKRWSDEDDDNHILPCPLKIFDVVSGEVVEKLEDHEEEVLSIKAVTFKNEHYYVSTSQDGYINRWKMDETWSRLREQKRMEDGMTCMAFTVSFLPNTGNKYFAAACDENIRIFDFESAQLIQTFEGIFTSYCDCVKVVHCIDYDAPPMSWCEVLDAMEDEDDEKEMFTYLMSRGVEELDAENNTINSKPNSVTLHKLVYPKKKGSLFTLDLVKRYTHEEYRSNSWLVKVTSNGRYIAAPTYDGSVVIFNMKSGNVTSILRDHQEIEVRDVIFHPSRKLLFTCADDGTVKVYKQSKKEVRETLEGGMAEADGGGIEVGQ
ncbi:hypothetical protein HK104_007766 [Borealophlyctis nickersoniae]|nr:hypothetical protein HK104_007766 [Borealophlyctis nickersoniae]